MIEVELKGGLGNQMFQFAAGRRLSHIHNTTLVLNLSWMQCNLPGVTPRNYALAQFPINAEISTHEDSSCTAAPEYGVVRSFVNKLNPFRCRTHIREERFSFNPSILSLPDNVYLDGYWQSEKYFADITDIIRSEFTFRNDMEGYDEIVAAQITSCMAVALHVRRDDYVNNAETQEMHGVCSIEYYKSAVAMIAEHISDPHMFVFSDDHAWVQRNMDLGYPTTFVTHNGADHAFEDLRLMSLCKHFIIANSSFSWWGAWLCSNHDKIVIAPKRWFNRDDIDTKDLIPPGWLCL